MVRRREPSNEKKKKYFTRNMQGATLGILLAIMALFLLLIGRIIYLRITKGTEYSNNVLSHQSYVSAVVPFQRGTITDRNGVELAVSTKIYHVILDPKVVLSNDGFVEPTIDALVEAFGLNEAELRSILENNSKSSYYVLLKNQPYENIAVFNEIQKKNHKVVKGVWFETEYERNYPYNSLASHVIGFTNKGNVGTYGIEQYYNEYLNGTDGRESGYYDSELNLIKKVWEATPGDTVVSTIDVYVQSVVEEKIAEFLDTYDCENIGVIVMDPDSGEIYAMASNEGYDLNNPRDISGIYSQEAIDAMTEQEQINALNKMWRNFCVNDTFEPGSTFKCLTVAAGLEEDVVETGDSFYCAGHADIAEWSIHCNKKTGHGNLSLTQSLMFSCNMALMDIAEEEGRTMFRYYQEHFGLGSKTGLDLPGEAAGILIDESKLNITELATSSFGQGFNVTMVQMAAAYSSLVNGGYYYRPHIVKEIVDANGATVYEAEDCLVRNTVTKSTSEFMKDATYFTVESGTATPAQVEGYLVGGKTGTAQKGNRADGKYVVSFVGSVPADDPEVVIYVVIDEIDDETLYNSSKPATTLTSAILKDALPYLGVYPDGEIDYGIEYDGEVIEGDEVNDGNITEGGTQDSEE